MRRPALLLALLVGACEGGRADADHMAVLGGDADRGRHHMDHYGCGACHRIDGLKGANGTVGPPLTDFGVRSYIAGAIPNSPDNLVRWIMNPQAIEPGTVMPNLGVSEGEARDIAAYLYTMD